MSGSVAVSRPLARTTAGRTFLRALTDAYRRHRLLHAMAIAALLLAAAVGMHTGNMPNLGALKEYAYYLFIAFWLCGCAFAVGSFSHLAVVKRDREPLGTFLRSLGSFFGDPERTANSLNGLAAAIIFISSVGCSRGPLRSFPLSLGTRRWRMPIGLSTSVARPMNGYGLSSSRRSR